ncbi:MAG: non-ribosomal peptide synthetase, partial [Flammeovirgaceae bacterium]
MKSQELLQDQKNWSNAKKLLLQKLLHGKADTNSIPKAQESNLYPLSLAQKRIWFLEELVPNQAVFNVPMAFKIEGKLDVGILKNSIKELSKRHRILSSKVVIEHGEPYQTLSHESPELTIVSPQHEEEADWQWAEKLAAQEAQKPISIHEGNYARFTLYAVADDQYLLVMVLHHIICDGWSFGIIFEELANAYKKLTGQSSSQQHDLPIQYTDFAVWQNQPAYLNTALPHIQYWKSKLQGKKATQPLSFKQPLKTNELTYQGKRLYFEWNTSLTSQLERYAKANKVTLNMLLTALYKLVFYCYTHEKNNLLGIPIANRNLPELEKLVGFVANTLVIQTEIDESQSFTTFMEQVKETCLNAYKHQDAPFEKVIEALQPERQLNHSQLFQTAFIFQNAPMKRVDFANLTLSMVDIHNGTAQFEISLTMTMLQDRLKGFFEYQQCLFSDQDIQHFSEKFEALALCMLKNPDLPIYQLKEQLNIPAQLAPAPQPIYNISKRFEAIAQQYPHAIAIKYGASELSYQQLNQKANTLAHQLIDHGVKPNDLVAIFCHKSTEMLIGLIAILKAGAAYLPLDPINPQARIKLILEQAAVNTLLLQPDLQETFDNLGINAIQRLHLRSDEEETETNPDRQVSDLQQAYVMFTSGSTGIPKGVMVSHLNVCRLFDALEQEIKFNHQDVWTLFHSFAFDFSVWEIWGALLYGGKLIIVDYWESRSPETFYKLVHKNKVSVLSQTPSAFYQLMDQWLENNQASTGALRVVVFGGEALHLQRLSPWIERFGAQKPALINMYGITETTVHVTNYKVSKQELVAEHLIGEPIADLSVHVYDENMQVVDDLQEGEMYVGGLGVSQGYYNSPRLTAQRFVPDPYSTKGERL